MGVWGRRSFDSGKWKPRWMNKVQNCKRRFIHSLDACSAWQLIAAEASIGILKKNAWWITSLGGSVHTFFTRDARAIKLMDGSCFSSERDLSCRNYDVFKDIHLPTLQTKTDRDESDASLSTSQIFAHIWSGTFRLFELNRMCVNERNNFLQECYSQPSKSRSECSSCWANITKAIVWKRGAAFFNV
jgi:hypothetical protein